MRKFALCLAFAFLWAMNFAQSIGIHVNEQVWDEKVPLQRLYTAKLYNLRAKTMFVSCFDYTVDERTPLVANTWILSNKLAVIDRFQKRTGVKVRLLIRCSRTFGTNYDTVPVDSFGQAQWANFVSSKARMAGGDLAGWNERSLGWASWASIGEEANRPERDAACVHRLILSMRLGGIEGRVLAPSVHSPSDGPIGDGLSYTRRFFRALPAADRVGPARVVPDVHLYYGALSPLDLNGQVIDEGAQLASYLYGLKPFGYHPYDVWATEAGCFWKSSTQVPTSAESGAMLTKIVATARAHGIPGAHIVSYSASSGPLADFEADGKTLTAKGQIVKKLCQ